MFTKRSVTNEFVNANKSFGNSRKISISTTFYIEKQNGDHARVAYLETCTVAGALGAAAGGWPRNWRQMYFRRGRGDPCSGSEAHLKHVYVQEKPSLLHKTRPARMQTPAVWQSTLGSSEMALQ